MNTITNLWNWLDGKKTTIGAVLLFLSTFLSEVIVSKWGVTAAWMTPSIETLNWLGMALTGLGLGHKALKPTVNPDKDKFPDGKG